MVPLKLLDCFKMLNDDAPIIDENTLKKVSKYNLITLKLIETTILLEVMKGSSTNNNKLQFFYTTTTINALNLATSVFKRCCDMIKKYHRDYVKNFIKTIAGVLMSLHSIYLQAPKEKKIGDSSPATDITLCYATSLLYRLGPYVLPSYFMTDIKRVSLNLKVGGKGKLKMSKEVQALTQASRSNTKHRRKDPNQKPKVKAEETEKKEVTGPLFIEVCSKEAYEILKIKQLHENLNKNAVFEKYLWVLNGKNDGTTVTRERKQLLEFDKSVIEIAELFKNVCNEKKILMKRLSNNDIKLETFKACDLAHKTD